MNKKFKVGAAKTRDGREAYIWSVEGGGDYPLIIQTKACEGEWQIGSRCRDGGFSHSPEHPMDLMPNVVPEKYVIEADIQIGPMLLKAEVFGVLDKLDGKKARVTIEVIEE